jgi:hypothetical protein
MPFLFLSLSLDFSFSSFVVVSKSLVSLFSFLPPSLTTAAQVGAAAGREPITQTFAHGGRLPSCRPIYCSSDDFYDCHINGPEKMGR